MCSGWAEYMTSASEWERIWAHGREGDKYPPP